MVSRWLIVFILVSVLVSSCSRHVVLPVDNDATCNLTDGRKRKTTTRLRFCCLVSSWPLVNRTPIRVFLRHTQKSRENLLEFHVFRGPSTDDAPCCCTINRAGSFNIPYLHVAQGCLCYCCCIDDGDSVDWRQREQHEFCLALIDEWLSVRVTEGLGAAASCPLSPVRVFRSENAGTALRHLHRLPRPASYPFLSRVFESAHARTCCPPRKNKFDHPLRQATPTNLVALLVV